jgi:hypothetical protein
VIPLPASPLQKCVCSLGVMLPPLPSMEIHVVIRTSQRRR